MGTNTLVTASDGQIIPASNNNQFHTALTQDILPRNISGVVTNNAGSLGSFTYIWNHVYGYTLNVGDSSTNNYIASATVGAGGGMQFYIGGVNKVTFDSSGLNGSFLTNLSVTNSKLATDSVTNTKIANNAVDANKIEADAVTVIKVLNRNITREKCRDTVISDDVDAFGLNTSTTFTIGVSPDFTVAVPAHDLSSYADASTIIKPIILAFQNSGTGNGQIFSFGGVGSSYIYITRTIPGSSESHITTFYLPGDSSFTPSSFNYIDTSFTAGQYSGSGNITYKAYCRVTAGGQTIQWSNVKLLAVGMK